MKARVLITGSIRTFWKSSKQDPKHELINQAKDPKAFEKYGKIDQPEQTLIEKEYEKHKKGMAAIKDSRSNMKVDMRPKVLMRVMTKEIILILFAFTAIVGMPLYFLKIKPALEAKRSLIEDKLQQRREEEMAQKLAQQRNWMRENYKDTNLSTHDKTLRFSDEELQEQIRQVEEDYERQVISNKRREQRERAERRKRRQERNQQISENNN